MSTAPAVFLDKDGTLIENIPYNVDPARIRLNPGAVSSLQALQHAGFKLIVVSNQSGVARGFFSEADLIPVREQLQALLAKGGVTLDDFYYCPHHPQGVTPEYKVSCSCRKPGPGLLHRAAREHCIDLSRSWIIGDILDDVEAGKAAGCRAILLNQGHETEWKITGQRRPDFIVNHLETTALVILRVAHPEKSRYLGER